MKYKKVSDSLVCRLLFILDRYVLGNLGKMLIESTRKTRFLAS